MIQPSKTLAELLAALEFRSYTTYKNRIQAFERIQARSRAWNTALISLATATTVAAVGLLVDDSMYGDSGAVLLAACSVLSLAASLTVSALDYPGRAVRMETSYKETQDLSSRVQALRHTGGTPTIADYNLIYGQYHDLIRHSENHTTADDEARDKPDDHPRNWTWRRRRSAVLTVLPYVTLLLPVWLLGKFGFWVISHAG